MGWQPSGRLVVLHRGRGVVTSQWLGACIDADVTNTRSFTCSQILSRASGSPTAGYKGLEISCLWDSFPAGLSRGVSHGLMQSRVVVEIIRLIVKSHLMALTAHFSERWLSFATRG